MQDRLRTTYQQPNHPDFTRIYTASLSPKQRIDQGRQFIYFANPELGEAETILSRVFEDPTVFDWTKQELGAFLESNSNGIHPHARPDQQSAPNFEHLPITSFNDGFLTMTVALLGGNSTIEYQTPQINQIPLQFLTDCLESLTVGQTLGDFANNEVNLVLQHNKNLQDTFHELSQNWQNSDDNKRLYIGSLFALWAFATYKSQ